MAIQVFRPSIKRKDMDAVLSCLVSDQLGPGVHAENLVHELLEKTDLEAGITLRERIRGMEILIRSLALEPGSRIAITPLSSKSYQYVIESLGHTMLLIDVDKDYPVIDLKILESIHAEEPIQALILDHHLGYGPDIEAVRDLKIPVIQDISNVFSYEKSIEYAGDFVLLSLEPNNIITAGGGVFIAGGTKKASKILTRVINTYPDEIYLPDMNAALGGIQLKELKAFIEQRINLAELLNHSLMQGKHRVLSRDDQPVPSLLPLLLNSPIQDVMQYALKKQVELIPAFDDSIINNLMRDYDLEGEITKSPAEQYPQSSRFSMRTVLIPLHPSLGRKEVDLLQKVIKTLP